MYFLLDNQTKLNNELMTMYDRIKKMRNPDNGFTNNDYSFPYLNLEILNDKLRRKIVDFFAPHDLAAIASSFNISKEDVALAKSNLEQALFLDNFIEPEEYIQFVMYDLALTIRKHDGHTYDETTNKESDNNKEDEFYNTDYPKIMELKNYAAYGSEFTESVKKLLSVPVPSYYSMTYMSIGISASSYFSLMYKLLLDTIQSTERVKKQKTRKNKSRKNKRRNSSSKSRSSSKK